MNNSAMVRRLSLVGITGNLFLSFFKLAAGIIGHSGAMVSDAVHSFSDVLATFIAMIGVVVAEKKEDKEHPYGHERFECVASMVLGMILGFTGIAIGYSGIMSLLTGEYKNAELPTVLPLAAAVISIVSKEAMYHYTMHYAKKMNSMAFKADAWHHRSDALSSVGSLAGIAAARLGFPAADPIASIVICIFIIKVAVDIIRNALRRMVDTSCDSETEGKMADYIRSVSGVVSLDLLHTRLFGNHIYVDVEISVDGELSLINAHTIAENVHHGLESNFADLKHVMVHVNPA